MSPSQLAITQLGWGFYTLRGGIYPGDLRFRPQVVGVVEVWREFSSGVKPLSSLGAAGPRRCPEGQLSPRADSMSLIQSATSKLGRPNLLRRVLKSVSIRFSERGTFYSLNHDLDSS